ncbi:hypothetical protein DE146DRAFT_471162 [Phaeosphaeria sp. MPI-PUGE-AT-0046c]|nr:hypothetical protein DE146DRAFT_471162 [Phaeosphaeria sp. MPI-PUGE-AT-0046c]
MTTISICLRHHIMPSTNRYDPAPKLSSISYHETMRLQSIAISALERWGAAQSSSPEPSNSPSPQNHLSKRATSSPETPITEEAWSASASEASTEMLSLPCTPSRIPRTPRTPRSLPSGTHNWVRTNKYLDEVKLGLTPCPGDVGVPNGAKLNGNLMVGKHLLGRRGWRDISGRQSAKERWLRWRLKRRGGAEYELMRKGSGMSLKFV